MLQLIIRNTQGEGMFVKFIIMQIVNLLNSQDKLALTCHSNVPSSEMLGSLETVGLLRKHISLIHFLSNTFYITVTSANNNLYPAALPGRIQENHSEHPFLF